MTQPIKSRLACYKPLLTRSALRKPTKMEGFRPVFFLCVMNCIMYVYGIDKVPGESIEFKPPEGCKTAGSTLSHRLKDDSIVPVSYYNSSDGLWKPQPSYERRLILSGSITLTDINMNDDGLYEFTCKSGRNNLPISLKVIRLLYEPSVVAGGNVTFPYSYVTAGDTRTFKVQRNGICVFELNFTSGNKTVGTRFQGRLSLSPEWKSHGNLSLTLEGVTEEDQGVYLFSIEELHVKQKDAMRLKVVPSVPGPERRNDTTSSSPEHEDGSHLKTPPEHTTCIVIIVVLACALVGAAIVCIGCIVYIVRLRTRRPRGAEPRLDVNMSLLGDHPVPQPNGNAVP
uniref:uncharacterized protein LOC124054734 n=1 Tax=Scatophagus argus TaxID=75038 RepID=UPI001ED83DC2|nr:uncharacterized protein LOC124054734 [Scatophagus argus]